MIISTVYLPKNNRPRPVPVRTDEKCLRWSGKLFGHDQHCPVVTAVNR